MRKIGNIIARYFLAVCATTAAGCIMGAFAGVISFVCAGYNNILFGADQGFPFGMISGFAWGVLFGWLILMYGYIKTSPAAAVTLLFALPPALLGNPALAWFAGMLGSIAAVPIVLILNIGEKETSEIVE